MNHPILSDGADEAALLRQQSLFMQSRARQMPAARIVRKKSTGAREGKDEEAAPANSAVGGKVQRDVITLDAAMPMTSSNHGVGPPTVYQPTRIHAPDFAQKHQAVDPFAARVVGSASRPPLSHPSRATGSTPVESVSSRIKASPHGERVDRFDTAGVISDIVEREFGKDGTAAAAPVYTPPALNKHLDSSSAKRGFPEVFKHSADAGPSRFRRQRQGVKKKKSVFASMLADARAKEAAAAEAAEAENAFSDGWRRDEDSSGVPGAPTGSSLGDSLAGEIHSENMQKLAGMSPAEIAEAQASLMRMLSPKTLEAIRKRKDRQRTQVPTNSSAISPESAAALREPPISAAASLSDVTTETELFERAERVLSVLDRAKLDWTKEVKVPTASSSSAAMRGREFRFDLDGVPVAPDADPQQLLGLHHHGRNPTAAGYAIDELLHLARSSHTAQRTMALRAIAGVLQRRGIALANTNQNTNAYSGSSHADAVLPRHLPEATLSILHMCFPLAAPAGVASLSFLSVAVDAMHAWLVPPPGHQRARAANSTIFRGFEGLPPTFHAQHTQSGQFASVQCRLDTAGHKKNEMDFLGREGTDSRGHSNAGEPKVEEEEGSESERKARLNRNGSQRPVYWLLRRNFCRQMSVVIRALGHLNDRGRAVQKCVEMVTFCARHSMLAAACVSKSKELLNAVKSVCLLPTPMAVGDALPSREKKHEQQEAMCTTSISAMKLLAVLCQSGKLIAEQLSRSGVLSLLKRFMIAATVPPSRDLNGETVRQNRQCEAALQVWRVCLVYGIDTEASTTVMLQSPRLLPLTTAAAVSIDPSTFFPACSTQVALYQVLEALCRPRLHSAEARAQLSHFIEHQCAIVLRRLISTDKETFHGGDESAREIAGRYGLSCARNKTVFVTGGTAAHFLASAISCGHLKAIDVSAARIQTNAIEVGDAGRDGPVVLAESLFAKMMAASPYVNLLVSTKKARDVKSEDLNAMHGYVRLAHALSSAGMLSRNAVKEALTSAKTLLSWLLTADTLELKTLASLSVVDVRAYSQRSRVFLLDALVDFRKEDNNFSPFVQINAALVCLPLVLPGDEAIASKMLSQGLLATENLESLWESSSEEITQASGSNSGMRTSSKELLELRAILYPYFRAFMGDLNCLKRSERMAKLPYERHSGGPQTLFLTPRVFGQQQSTLPLPPHWLYLPLCDEEDEDEGADVAKNGADHIYSLSAMVAGLTLAWKLEMCEDTGAHGAMSKLTRELKIFAIMQVALTKDSFIFDPTSGAALATLLEMYLRDSATTTPDEHDGMFDGGKPGKEEKQTAPLDFESRVGRRICVGLTSRVTSRFVQEPRCHVSPFYALVMHTLLRGDMLRFDASGAGQECRTLVWQACVEAKMTHALEKVCACGLKPLLERSITPTMVSTTKLVRVYCSALRQSLWHRRHDCKRAYGLALQAVASFVFDWAGMQGVGASDYDWTRKDLFETLSRGATYTELTAAVVECGNVHETSGDVQPANADIVKSRWQWIEGKASLLE